MEGSRCVGPVFLNTKRLWIEDEPIYPTDDLGRATDKRRPFQRRRASIHIREQLVYRKANPPFPDQRHKMVLSQITENRKVEARKSLILQHTIFTFGLKKATLRQNL
jgi:hypothetical protein